MEKFKKWIKAAGMRSLRTVVQSVLGVFTAAVTFWDIDWKAAIGVALYTGIYSLLMCIAGLPEIKEEIEVLPEATGADEPVSDEQDIQE